jgi:phosphonate transport system permease protein
VTARSRLLRLFIWTITGIVIFAAYALSIKVTQPDFIKLIVASPKAGQILPQLLTPDLLSREAITSTISLAFPIPCGSAEPGAPSTDGPTIFAQPNCASPGAMFMLRGENLSPNADVRVLWRLPEGKSLTVKRITTDADGAFSEQIQARPIAAAKNGKPTHLEAETSLPSGAFRPAQTLTDVINAMFVTIFMALLATTIGTILAIPLSFLAARNITYHGTVGKAVYTITRSFLNIIRSYEPLVMATIFALVVGFGNPFAGVLALVIVTTASLGKMFSESIEGIENGPIEAITATGANRAQVIIYGVVPQIIPDFLSYTFYHWDINVRISTIIGFVGGGGIGYFLSQSINTFAYHKAGTALMAIILVVWMLDFLSSEIRRQLT